MFKKPEDISPLPAGMMDAFTKTVNSQLGNYDVAQEAPAPEAPSAEAAIPEQPLEEGKKVDEGNAFTKALSAARDNGDDEFIVSGKKYRVEDYDEDEEDEDDEDEDKKDKEELDEDNTNDKSDDGEGLDKVQPKAVKKKFKDRKDKDIDNDGDTDDSDEYLHKRRKAISKALTKESAEELAELKNTHAVIDTAQGGKVVSVATNEKGAKSSIVSAEKPPMNIKDKKTLKVVQLKKPISRNKDIIGTVLKAEYQCEESGDLGKPEGFFSEEMDPTDHVRFNKETNMFCVYDKDGKKVYESEKEEEANTYAIDNHDALMGKNDLAEIRGKLNKKGEIEMTKANFAKVHKDYKTKIKGQPYAMQIDPKSGGSALFPVKFIKESVELDEKYQQFTDKTPNWGESEALTYGRKKGYKEVAVMGDGKGVHAMVLFALNAEDKKFVRSANVKSGESVFRYTTKISIAGDIFPLVKVNIAKGIFYPLTQESSDGSIETAKFETRGVKLKFFRSLEGAKLESVDLEEKLLTSVQGKDNKKYSIELDKSGRKVMVRTKNQFGDIKTISLKQAAKLFEASDLEKLEERKIDPADQDDMVATKGDKESAKMNIIVQLRKAADVKGNLDIVFADGKKQKVPANIIKIALDKYNSFRKPATKKKLVDGMSKSYRSMLQTLKTIKEYSEESESKES